ncbi:hypothetical protein ABT090_25260 [Streptomyces asoensis]|uniref:hypothetical protein n=1 Tax=Streptomyces asoensis TaxID=249586 RepID=UPI003325552C
MCLLGFCLSGVASAWAADGGADNDSAGRLVVEIGWDASRQEVVVRGRCTYSLPAGSEALAQLRKEGDAFCRGYSVQVNGQDPATDGWDTATNNVTQESPHSPAWVEAKSVSFLSRRSGPQELEVSIAMRGALDGHPEGLPEVWTVEVRAPRWSFRQIRGPVESQSAGAVSWTPTTAKRWGVARSVVLQRNLRTTKPDSTRQQTRFELVTAFEVAVLGTGAVSALLVARLAGPSTPRRWARAALWAAVATYLLALGDTQRPPLPTDSSGIFTLTGSGVPGPDTIWKPGPTLGLWLWYVLPVAGWWFTRRVVTGRPPSPRVLLVSCVPPLLAFSLVAVDGTMVKPGVWSRLIGIGVCALLALLALRHLGPGGSGRRWAATAGALVWIVGVTLLLGDVRSHYAVTDETELTVGLLCTWPAAAWLTSLSGPVLRRTLGLGVRTVCFVGLWSLLMYPSVVARVTEPAVAWSDPWSYYRASFFEGYLGFPLCVLAVCGVALQLVYLLRRGAVGGRGRAVEPVGRVLLVCAALMALGNPSLRTLSMWGDALAVLWVALGSLLLLPVGADTAAAKFRRVGRQAHARFMDRWVGAQLVWDARADLQRTARSALTEDNGMSPSDFSAHWDALKVPGRCGDPATRLARLKRFALGSSAGVAPRIAGPAGAALALLLALPWATYKLVTGSAVGADGYMPFHLTEISKVLRFAHWALYGFVFGYYYALLRGSTPIGKAGMLMAVVLPAEVLSMTVLTVDPQYTTAPSWADMAVACGGLAGQTFVVCMGLGLCWEWWLARAAAMKWSQVRNFRRLSSITVPLSTVLVAAATAFATVVAGAWAQQELQPPSSGSTSPPPLVSTSQPAP